MAKFGRSAFADIPNRSKAFVMGRNAHGRPNLQHVTRDYVYSVCGVNLSVMVTRRYGSTAYPALLCLRCARAEGIDLSE